MTTAERIETYTRAAAKSGLPVREVIIEGRKIRILFGDALDGQDGEGLRKNWTAKK
jgi:hypothetical protein